MKAGIVTAIDIIAWDVHVERAVVLLPVRVMDRACSFRITGKRHPQSPDAALRSQIYVISLTHNWFVFHDTSPFARFGYFLPLSRPGIGVQK